MPMSNSEIKFAVTTKEAIASSTSKGNVIKWCKDCNGTRMWLKADYLGYEGLSEVIASRVAMQTNLYNTIGVVEYQPCKIVTENGRRHVGCYSVNYIPNNVEEITLGKLVKRLLACSYEDIKNKCGEDFVRTLINSICEYMNISHEQVTAYLSYIVQFDALILNEDRHVNNILFFRDSNTYRWSTAPVFDNGLSLLSDLKLDYGYNVPLDVCLRKVSNKAKPFVRSFSKQIRLLQQYTPVQLELADCVNVQISDLYNYYNEQAIQRVCKVLEIQIQKYFAGTRIVYN